jgi:hypothetical protein
VGIGMVTAETPDQSAMALLGLPGAAEAPALKMLAQEEAVVGPALKQASAEMETAAPVVSKMEQAAAPMSEVAASEANMCQGVEASASTSPAMTPITNPQRLLPGMTTGAANNVRGNAFEKLVMDSLRAEKNAAKASSVATRVNAVPEVMNDVRFGGGLEAKDEKYLSLTKQIKAEIAIAQTGPQKGPFYMVIGPGTARASMPLQNAVNRTGGGFFEYNPVTDTWSTVQFNGTRVVRAPPPHP